MKKLFIKDKKSHYIALFLAVSLHLLIGSWFLFNKSKPVVIQQTIVVEMVSPSSKKQIKKEINKKENLITSSNSDAKTIKNSNSKITPVKSEDDNLKNSSQIESSGKINKNAIAKNSAVSEPIFNASYLQNPTPPYPSYARSKGFEGKVILEVLVSKNGTAKTVTIFKSSGYDTLDNAAKYSVEKWRFVPAYIGVETVEAKVLVPIEFKLK